MDLNYGDTCTLSCRAPSGGTYRWYSVSSSPGQLHVNERQPKQGKLRELTLRPFFVGVSTIASCPSDNIEA